MLKSSGIAAVVLSSFGLESVSPLLPHYGRTRYPTGWNRLGWGFHPSLNRHTGQPHEHRREISRNQRRAALSA